MISKARHYRVVSRSKNTDDKSVLSIKKDDLSVFSCLAFIIWIFGILIGYALSHNK